MHIDARKMALSANGTYHHFSADGRLGDTVFKCEQMQYLTNNFRCNDRAERKLKCQLCLKRHLHRCNDACMNRDLLVLTLNEAVDSMLT